MKGLNKILLSVVVVSTMSYYSSDAQITSGWESEASICQGDWYVPWYYLYPYLAYNLKGDGRWIIISGREAYGGYFGFYWDSLEERWVYDESLTQGLTAHGWEEAPALAYNIRGDNKWILIGHQGSDFYGYYWDGNQWIEDISIVAGLSDISGEIKHCFISSLMPDGKWTLVTGTDEGLFRAFYWESSQSEWIEDPTRVAGIPDIGEHTSVTAGFNLRGDNRWVLIATNYSDAFPRGFYWGGTEWIEDSSIVKGLPYENILKPTLGYNVFGDSRWVLYMGYPHQGSILGYVYHTVDASNLPQQQNIAMADSHATTALISFNYPYTWTHRVKYSLNPGMTDALWSNLVYDEDTVQIQLHYLQPDTTYYYQVCTYVPWDTIYYVTSSIYAFHTLPAQSYYYLTPGQSIQDAIEMLPPEGGTIELSSGIFQIDEPIRIWIDNVTLKGQGMDRTTITPKDSFEGHMIQISKSEDPYYKANWIYTHKDFTFWFNYPQVPLDTTILIKNVSINDLSLEGNHTNGGIYCVEIWNSTFTHIKTENTTGAISVSPGINVLIENCISEGDRIAYWLTLLSRSCYIKNCEVTGAYGWITSVHTNGSKKSEYVELPPYPPPEISNNQISNCIDGIHIYSTYDAIVSKNLIDGCRREGINITISSNILVSDNIVRNHEGLMPSLHYGEAENSTFIRNIIYNNEGNGFGMSDRYQQSRTGKIINNVFWNNTGDAISNPYSVEQQIIIKNNIIAMNGGWGINGPFTTISYNDIWANDSGSYHNASPDTGNIYLEPLFFDPEQGDFHLKSRYGRWDGSEWVRDDTTSSCIDAGDPADDYSNEPEPNGARINLGVYGNTAEASKSYGVTAKIEVFVYPNPYRGDRGWPEHITFGNLPAFTTIRIYTLSGDLVKTIEHQSEADGSIEIWDISDIVSGVYIYSIKSMNGKKVGKVSIIK